MSAIINIAIDPPDLLQNLDNDLAFEEDLSVNEIESVIELVMEKGMNMDNAIPESDDNDSEDFCKKPEIVSFFSYQSTLTFIFNPHKLEYITQVDGKYYEVYSLNDNPPPRG